MRRARKLSANEVAAQGLLDLVHVEKVKLHLTDEAMRAWRPSVSPTPEPVQADRLAAIDAARVAHAEAVERRHVAWQRWLDTVKGISIHDTAALMAPDVRRVNAEADAALADLKRARANVEKARRAALPAGSCPGSEAQLGVGGRVIPPSEYDPGGSYTSNPLVQIIELDTNFYCGACRAVWTRRAIWALHKGEYAPLHARVDLEPSVTPPTI